jgi:hypothetical protein
MFCGVFGKHACSMPPLGSAASETASDCCKDSIRNASVRKKAHSESVSPRISDASSAPIRARIATPTSAKLRMPPLCMKLNGPQVHGWQFRTRTLPCEAARACTRKHGDATARPSSRTSALPAIDVALLNERGW